MRVLFITSSYPASEQDPRGTFIHVLARSLVEQGVEITVLAPGAPGARKTEKRDGVQICRATYWIPRWQAVASGMGGIVPNLRAKPWLLLQLPSLIIALIWRAVRLARSADVIHAHWVYPSGIAGVAAAKLCRRSLVVTSHGGDLNLASQHHLLRLLSSWIARRAALCIGVSPSMAKRLVCIGVDPERVKYVPLGVNVERADHVNVLEHSPELRAYAAFTGLRVVYVGGLIPKKSVETLIEAQRQLNSAELKVASLIVGAGPSMTALREQAARPGTGLIVFVGGQRPEFVPSYMSFAHVLVLPSLAEGRGLVLVEAMMLGLPTIASDIDGPRELIEDGVTGLLFPPGEVSGLAACLERLLVSPSLGPSLGLKAHAAVTAAGLSVVESARRHAALYAELSPAAMTTTVAW